MLSHGAIEQRIGSGEIKITYYFIRDAADSVTFFKNGIPVSTTQANEASAFFSESLRSDRLNLTLGPIVKSHNRGGLMRRKKFRGRIGYVDIRDSNNAIVMAPNETLSVATNERIALGPSTAALIVPRLTLGDSGILLNVSYIDPYWDGTLQLVITNATPYAQQLSFLEDIAQCFFF